MDIRPCPRCCKLVPVEASFCRRCGAALRPQAFRGGCGARVPGRCGSRAEVRLGSRWASTVAATATAALGVVLALFAVSGPRVAVRHYDPVSEPEPATSGRFASDELDGVVPRYDVPRRRWERGPAPSFAATRKQSMPGRRAVSNPALDGFAARNPPRHGGPQITAVVGPSAGYGHKVTIRGSRLGGARRVLFIGTERGRADARFHVWDDGHLLVSVPDLGPWEQAAAVAVVTNEGVAVSVPSWAPAADSTMAITPPGTVFVVPAGGAFAGTDASIVFVEGGAAARAAAGGTLFIRRDGSAWGNGGGDCLLYCERGVVIKSDVKACDLVEVEAVNPCPVDALFHYAGR